MIRVTKTAANYNEYTEMDEHVDHPEKRVGDFGAGERVSKLCKLIDECRQVDSIQFSSLRIYCITFLRDRVRRKLQVLFLFESFQRLKFQPGYFHLDFVRLVRDDKRQDKLQR